MKKPILYCDDGSEIELPTKFEVCPTCEGRGKSSAYLGAFTRDQLDDQGPEWCEDYFRGDYDRACDECRGQRVIAVADRGKMTKAQWREFTRQERDSAECDRIQRQERLMEGGWREEGWFE
jgi:hypothetical protein